MPSHELCLQELSADTPALFGIVLDEENPACLSKNQVLRSRFLDRRTPYVPSLTEKTPWGVFAKPLLSVGVSPDTPDPFGIVLDEENSLSSSKNWSARSTFLERRTLSASSLTKKTPRWVSAKSLPSGRFSPGGPPGPLRDRTLEPLPPPPLSPLRGLLRPLLEAPWSPFAVSPLGGLRRLPQVLQGEGDHHVPLYLGPSLLRRLEAWLLERLALLEERFPGAREAELLGVWAGKPPRLEVIARVRLRCPSP